MTLWSKNELPGEKDIKLMFGCIVEGSVDAVRHLLENDKDGHLSANVMDPTGFLPMNAAAFYGQVEIMKLLLEKGAKLDAKDQRDYTPLMAAAMQGRAEAVSFLLEQGADFAVDNRRGQTALWLAACYGRADCVDLLIKAGASPLATDRNGQTAFDIARDRNMAEVQAVFNVWQGVRQKEKQRGENLQKLDSLLGKKKKGPQN